MNFKEIRRRSYEYHEKYYSYMFKWPWYSYRKYKAHLYMELASIVAFFSLRAGITPNMITLFYIFLGLISGLLLAIPNVFANLAAIVIIFFKPTLDWADGLLARVKNTTSTSGDVLDNYSALVSWVSLWSGLGLYLGNTTSSIFYYLAVVIPSFYALDIYANARERFIWNYLKTRPAKGEVSAAPHTKAADSSIDKAKAFIDNIFEYNARTVDLICLAILAEIVFSIRIVWIFYTAFLLWQAVTFLMRIYLVAFKGRAEDELKKLEEKVYG